MAFAALLALTTAVYARALHGEFTFDDAHTIEQNHDILHPGHFLRLAAAGDLLLGKRVLTDFTFSLNHLVSQDDPWAYHLTNLAIHLVAVCLVYAFTQVIVALCGLRRRDLRSLGVAAVFALHPLQTQAVIYISQRAESLASVLYLGAFLLLLRAEQQGKRPAGVAAYLGAFLLFVLGLGSKVIMFTMPLAYLLAGILPARPWPGAAVASGAPRLASLPKRLALAAPFIAYGVLTVALAVKGMKGDDAGFNVPSLPPGRYFLTQWRVVVTYLRLLFWPAGQNIDWDIPFADGLADPIVISCGLVLTLLLGAAAYYLRHRGTDARDGPAARATAFGVFWFFLLLCPTSTLVPLADVLMEHRTYLASWGIVFATFVVIEAAVDRFRLSAAATERATKLIRAAGLATCAVLAIATYARVGLWKTKLLLWTDVVAKSPQKARPHLGLANVYKALGDPVAAIPEYRTALTFADREPQWIRSITREYLSLSLLEVGQLDEAIDNAKVGLTEDPPGSGLHGVLAAAYVRRGDIPEAMAAAQEAVRTSSGSNPALRVLGMTQNLLGDHDKAIDSLAKAVQADPDDAQARVLLAWVYQTQDRQDEACRIVAGLRNPPRDVEARMKKILADCPVRDR